MRLLIDLKSHIYSVPTVVQVDKTPPIGTAGQVAINGKYAFPMPVGSNIPVDADSYIFSAGQLDGGDLISKGFAHLLAQYPQYSAIYFNPLLNATHIEELDPNGVFEDHNYNPSRFYAPRYQYGRPASAVTDTGQIPTHTALLPVNSEVSQARPGMLVTTAIDISSQTLDCNGDPAGAFNFMPFWKLYDFDVGEDIQSEYGIHGEFNQPANRYLREISQEPSNFSVYLSTDGGSTWCPAGLMEPMSFANPTTSVLMAFLNFSTSKRYIAHFGFMF